MAFFTVPTITSGVLNWDEKVDIARLDRREMQYLYADDTGLVFMDTETYDQVTIPRETLGDSARFLKESQMVSVLQHAGTSLGVDLPTTVDLEVTETETRAPGRPQLRRHEAGDAGDRGHRPGSAVRHDGGDRPDRYAHRRLRDPGPFVTPPARS